MIIYHLRIRGRICNEAVYFFVGAGSISDSFLMAYRDAFNNHLFRNHRLHNLKKQHSSVGGA